MNLRIADKGKVKRRFCLILLTALIILTTLGTAGCTTSVPKELSDNQNLWEDQGLQNYDFTLERQCFCPEDWRGPVNIEVRNGNAVSVTYVAGGAAVTDDKFANADTIKKLFTILENAYAGKGDFDQKAERIEVTYDAEMGYPSSFFIDVSQLIADEEQGYTVTNLVPR